MERAKFDKTAGLVRKALKNAAQLRPEEYDEVVGKLGELRRRSFARLLTELLEEFQVPPSGSERPKLVERIVESRNSLVHRGEFITPPPARATPEYLELVGLLDRIILRMLGYDGEFLDATHQLTLAKLVAA
jgi:hypothetical protein